jgi:hypothetical protein
MPRKRCSKCGEPNQNRSYHSGQKGNEKPNQPGLVGPFHGIEPIFRGYLGFANGIFVVCEEKVEKSSLQVGSRSETAAR